MVRDVCRVIHFNTILTLFIENCDTDEGILFEGNHKSKIREWYPLEVCIFCVLENENVS